MILLFDCIICIMYVLCINVKRITKAVRFKSVSIEVPSMLKPFRASYIYILLDIAANYIK